MTKKTKTTPKKTAAKTTPSKPRVSATTAAILGQLPAKSKKNHTNFRAVDIKPEWIKFYEILMELRERLLLQMDGLAKESAEQMAGYSLLT